MKTLTTMTAIAALIAGISIASAQMQPKSGQMGTSGSSAATGSQQITGNAGFCLEATPGGALNCKYANLAACQKDAASSGKCQPNPKSSTTGSGQKQ
jgi:hypothetical protein